ncbi:MAG: DUF2892 domain-containing protein [Ramlibacter sp.]
MKTNVGTLDRVLRIGAAIVLFVLYATGTLGAWSIVVGLVLLVTGLVRFCPAYRLLGIRTCGVESGKLP